MISFFSLLLLLLLLCLTLIPQFRWTPGDRDLDFTNTQTVMEPRPASGDSKVSITSKLNYAFQAVDHGKLLRCVTNGPWLSMEDPRETFAQLNVICEFFFSFFLCSS